MRTRNIKFLALLFIIITFGQNIYAEGGCLSGIRTSGGNADGACCTFPFMYGGKSHDSCTSLDHDKQWCYTDNTGKWGNCPGDTSCISGIHTVGGNADGACCTFPFMYGGKSHNSCTSLGHDKQWCYTDKTGKWGNCPGNTSCISGIRTVGGNADGACCTFPFMYGGKSHDSCTSLGHDKQWCYTDNTGKWGNCPGGCLSGIRTSGGNADGACCRFPFMYSGKKHDKCTSLGHDKQWCYTENTGKWGNCPGDCLSGIRTSGGNADGACCRFPFMYRGRRHDNCTSLGHDKQWCYTENTGKWGNCPEMSFHAGKMPCTEYVSRMLKGIFDVDIPQCKADGTYEEKQCSGFTKDCWCVDSSSGKEIKGTRKNFKEGRVNCDTTTTITTPALDHESSVKVDMKVYTTGGGAYGSPRIHLQLNLNSPYEQQRLVPETCYASPSESLLDPRKFYLIKNRCPTVLSRIRRTPTTFSSSSELPFSVFKSLVQSAQNPSIRCKVRLCPMESNGCNFGYRMTEAEKLKQMIEDIKIEERQTGQGEEEMYDDKYGDEQDDGTTTVITVVTHIR